MKEYTIDCTGCEHPRALHRALAEALSFPEWYGNNLDALHDMLSAITEDTNLILTDFSSLPAFANGFRRVLTDCEKENPNLNIII